MLVTAVAPAVPAGAGRPVTAPSSTGGAGLGIGIIDVPAAHVDDPRARAYLVDHLKPGTTIHRRLRVSNTSPGPLHVELYAGAATIVGTTFTDAPGRTGDELSGWVTTNPTVLDLPAGGDRAVEVNVAVPPAASSGERYGVVWAEIAETGGDGVRQVNRVGIRMYLDIGPGGDPPTDFQIGDVSMTEADGGWPALIAAVHNTGGRAIDLGGDLTLSSSDGAVRAGPFSVTNGVTIPPGGRGQASVLIDRPLPAGVWTAELTLRSGTVSRTVSTTVRLDGSNGGQIAAVTPAASNHAVTLWSVVAGAVLAILAVLFTVPVLRRRRARAGVSRS